MVYHPTLPAVGCGRSFLFGSTCSWVCPFSLLFGMLFNLLPTLLEVDDETHDLVYVCIGSETSVTGAVGDAPFQRTAVVRPCARS